MASNSVKELYFHVGLGKTASTYLQYRFFPFLKGITYIQRTRYRNFQKHIEAANAERIFISNEFDRQLEKECNRFAAVYPEAKTIIILRRQDSWIASQYRRSVKNGASLSFEEYIDLDSNSGEWKIEDLYFFDKLKFLEKTFNSTPLVLFHDDLRKHPGEFFDAIAQFTGSTYDIQDIDLNPKHKSYSEKQLKFIRKVGKTLFAFKSSYSSNYYIRKVQRFFKMLVRYSVLFIGKILPEKYIENGPLIEPELLSKVKDFYAEDWEKCRKYAKESGLTNLTG